MQTQRPHYFFKSAIAIFTVFSMIGFLLPAFAAEESAEPKPAPTTTANPEIPVKELQYRLVPLSKNPTPEGPALI
jgi:energy-converting hydrogenase Eha subunit F